MEEEKAKGNLSNSSADEKKLGGNIVLSGFSLEPVEMIVVKKIIGTYIKKIGEKADYQEARITLKMGQKAQSFLHQINVDVRVTGGVLGAESSDRNVYAALASALEKVYNQAEHKEKTSRQTK